MRHVQFSFSNRPAKLHSAFKRPRPSCAGLTLIELLISCAILIILATAALPITRIALKERKESDLRYDLRTIREAIDRYKDAADKNLIQVQAGTEGYPPDLQTLVKGVQLSGAQDRRMRFLREIPKDPMTGTTDWGLRSVQDDPDSTSWGGQDVFDVYTRSSGMALNGSQYSTW